MNGHYYQHDGVLDGGNTHVADNNGCCDCFGDGCGDCDCNCKCDCDCDCDCDPDCGDDCVIFWSILEVSY